MNRLKTFGKYALWVILFYIFSNFLIFIGLNSTYKDLKLKDTLPNELNITTAAATSVNGKIRGTVSDDTSISDKYIKLDFYNKNDSLVGTKYIKISELKDNGFELYFKLNYVKSYSVSICDGGTDSNSNNFSFREYQKYQVAYWLTMLMFL